MICPAGYILYPYKYDPHYKKEFFMKDQRKNFTIAAAAAACILTAVPVCACTSSDPADDHMNPPHNFREFSPDDPAFWDIFDPLPVDPGSVSYIVDLLDWNGEILDSRICQYGDSLDDIPVPETWTDGQYIYEFTGWDPQIPETVTESVACMAVYKKTETTKSVSCPVMQETSDPLTKAASDSSGDTAPDRVTQVSATSYDVTPFHIETLVPSPEAADLPTESPLPPKTAAKEDEAGRIGTPDDPGDSEEDAQSVRVLLTETDTSCPDTLTEAPHPVPIELPDLREPADPLPSAPVTYVKNAAEEAVQETRNTPAPAKTGSKIKKSKKTSQDQRAPRTTPTAVPRSTPRPAPEQPAADITPLPALLVGFAVSSGTFWFKNRHR